MKKIPIYPVLSFLAVSIYSSLGNADEINTDFMHGISEVPSVLKDGVVYPAGQYYVDVMLNGSRTGRMPLTVNPDEEKSGQLCLSPEWLYNAGIFVVAQ
ncbi:FimD/PapC N-terminal domain-containing protein [Salmonella enterica]|nr:hypothetical protein [Salmonella enterica]EHC5972865.1 hypothetical protein [Salmonella enterica]EIU9581806.1 hypothetical protein [Salmonella enterica]ELC1719950.1 hypothetical protein [Salmonella enterica]